MEISQASDDSPYEKRVDAKGRVLSEECIAGEVPFEELPEGWAWARLAGVASIQLGKMLDKQKNEGEPVPYLGNANVQWGEFDFANIKTMRMNEADRAKFALANGDLIVCEGGVPGRCAIWTSNKTMHYQKALHRVRCDKRLLLNTYCELYIRLIVQSHIWDGCFTGTTIKHLPAQTLSSWVLPVPPLAEQRRIVERVNQLMPLVEEYGDLEDAREELDVALPERLRKSVLQMAVQGKLVPQDPADEPASVLLERIREQRRKMIAEKKMKAPKGGESIIFRGSDGRRYEKRIDVKGRESGPACIEDEIPFEIPDGWEWVRLSSIASFGGGKTPSTNDRSNYAKDGVLWVTSKDMKKERIDSTQVTLSEKGASELTLYPKGCIVMVTRSGILRRLLPVAILGRPSTVNQDQKVVIPNDCSLSEWLLRFFQGSDQRIRSDFGKDGTTVESIVFDKIRDMLIAVPPLAEQKRIDACLKELIPLITNQ